MSKYALWTMSSKKFYTIIGLSMIPAFVGLSIAIWALITGHMTDKWVVPVSVGLVHIFMPVTMGLPWFALLGAIDVKFPPKKID